MIDEPLTMRKKVQEILFIYRVMPLKNGKSPAELYLGRQIQIKLDAFKPARFQKSPQPLYNARQFSVGEIVQARYYSENRIYWKLGSIIEKSGRLHYLVKIDDSFVFKRHINQLLKTKLKEQKLTNHSLNQSEESPTKQLELNIGDLITYQSNVPFPDQQLQ